MKPATGGTAGKLNMDAHVFAGAEITGAVGKITILIVLLIPHVAGPVAPAAVEPHADVSAYWARTV